MRIPKVSFGKDDASKHNWRDDDEINLAEEDDDEDEELETTPQDVIDMLGFDPKEKDSTVKRLKR